MLNQQQPYSYVYQEYPKALYPPDGKSRHPVIVKDADAEAAQIKLWTPEPEPVVEPQPVAAAIAPEPIESAPIAAPDAPLVASADREALIAKAEAAGIKVDGRWSDKRLADEIAATA